MSRQMKLFLHLHLQRLCDYGFSILKVKPAGLWTCFPHRRKSFIRAEPSEKSEALQKASNMSWDAFFTHCNINEKRKRLADLEVPPLCQLSPLSSF